MAIGRKESKKPMKKSLRITLSSQPMISRARQHHRRSASTTALTRISRMPAAAVSAQPTLIAAPTKMTEGWPQPSCVQWNFS
eukprot:2722659-Prymnesium_polylepis.2